jgi:hypothetical protein
MKLTLIKMAIDAKSPRADFLCFGLKAPDGLAQVTRAIPLGISAHELAYSLRKMAAELESMACTEQKK